MADARLHYSGANAEHEVCSLCPPVINVGSMRPEVRETLVTWSIRVGFALVGVLSLYLFIRGS